jgi:hypothetical protein
MKASTSSDTATSLEAAEPAQAAPRLVTLARRGRSNPFKDAAWPKSVWSSAIFRLIDDGPI